MAALDFQDRAETLAYLTSRLPQADVSVIEALLDASAATTCGNPPVTVYRPFWVEAHVRATERTGEFASATSAAGSSVTYRDTVRGVQRSLLHRQGLLDRSLCSIPLGYEAGGGNAARVVF